MLLLNSATFRGCTLGFLPTLSSNGETSPSVPTLRDGRIGIKSWTMFGGCSTVGNARDSETIDNVGASRPFAEVFQ